jgi:hypothetical protein
MECRFQVRMKCPASLSGGIGEGNRVMTLDLADLRRELNRLDRIGPITVDDLTLAIMGAYGLGTAEAICDGLQHRIDAARKIRVIASR